METLVERNLSPHTPPVIDHTAANAELKEELGKMRQQIETLEIMIASLTTHFDQSQHTTAMLLHPIHVELVDMHQQVKHAIESTSSQSKDIEHLIRESSVRIDEVLAHLTKPVWNGWIMVMVVGLACVGLLGVVYATCCMRRKTADRKKFI